MTDQFTIEVLHVKPRYWSVEFRDATGIGYSEPVPEQLGQEIVRTFEYSIAQAVQAGVQPAVWGIQLLPLLAAVAPDAIHEQLATAREADRFDQVIAGQLVRFVRVDLQKLRAMQRWTAEQMLRAPVYPTDDVPGDDIVFEPTGKEPRPEQEPRARSQEPTSWLSRVWQSLVGPPEEDDA